MSTIAAPIYTPSSAEMAIPTLPPDQLPLLKDACIREKKKIPGVPSALIGDVSGEDIAWAALKRLDEAEWDHVIRKIDHAIMITKMS